MVTRRRTAAGLLAAALIWAAAAAASSAAPRVVVQAPAASFEPTGLQPSKGYFGQLPFERIDMINGGVILSFTDLVLPGNAGMDLRMVRNYNSQRNGRRWEFGIDGVPIRITHPAGNGQQCCEYPTLVMADGSQHPTKPRNSVYGDTVFLTEQFWRYKTTTRKVELPNGWVATYESGDPVGGVMLVSVQDHFGNLITPDWDSSTGIRPFRLDAVTQTVGSNSRTVEFTYDSTCPPGVPKTMAYGGRTWTYGCQASSSGYSGNLLTSVTPPTGPGWSFSHVEGNGLDGKFTVTTPHGGWVEYDYADQVLPSTDSIHRSVIATRKTGGRQIVPGEWSFVFEQSGPVPSQGTVSGPGGRSLAFMHAWAPSPGKWVLAQKVLREGSTAKATWSRQYEDLPYADAFPYATYPVPTFDTLLQEGATYTIDYQYASAAFGNYHQPWRTVETGPLTRTTTRTFWDDYPSTRYFLNRVASETVTVGSESFAKAWDYDSQTAFLEVETLYGVTSQYVYDAQGNRESATDANGQTTTFTYEWGAEKNVTRPEASTSITRSINADGTVASETVDGATTTFGYDTLGRLTQVTPALGQATTTGYHSGGEWVDVTRGPTVQRTWLDGFGRPRGTEDALGIDTRISYDADGRKTYQSYPYLHGDPVHGADEGESFEYDALNRLTKVIRPGGAVLYRYPTPTLVDIEDELGRTTRQTWHAFGNPDDRRLVSVTDPDNKTWAYTYNAVGSLTGVNQPDGPARAWTYDSHNWLTQEVHPESGTVDYAAYDNVANLKRKEVRGTGETITYGYDNNGRLKSINTPVSPHNVTFGYDGSDNRTHVTNEAVATTLDYDDANRPWRRTDVIDFESFVTLYGYDTRDNLTSVTYPSGRVVGYEYDDADRVTRVCNGACQPGGSSWASSFAYHPSGAVKGYTSGNGTTTIITHDNRHRPDVLKSGPLWLDYGYDNVGNVKTIDDLVREGFDQTFDYDPVDRLETVTGFGTATYTYDARGNRRTRSGTTYTYNALTDRLTSDGTQTYTYNGVGSVATAGTHTYTYTPFQMLSTATVGGAVTTYRYDGDNQRRQRLRPNGTKDYFVPGPGLVPLAEYRKAPAGSRVLVREYIYAGDRLIASVGLEPSPLPAVTWTDHPLVANVTAVKAVHLTELRDAVNAARVAHGLGAVSWTNATIAGGAMVIQAVHIAELRTAIDAVYIAVGAPLSSYTNAPVPAIVRAADLNDLRAARTNAPVPEPLATRFYHLDALGSVRAVTDLAGTTVRRHDYAAFGEAPTPTAGADSRRFTGKERDTETGLDYFSARYYAATTGRFTTVDPYNIVAEAQDETQFVEYLSAPQRWNRYGNALANPLTFTDPDGRNPQAATLWARIVNIPQVQRLLNSDVGRRVADSLVVTQSSRALQTLNERLFELSMRLFASPADEVAVGQMRLSNTVANHLKDVVTKGDFKGELARPFLDSNLLVQQIMKAAKPIADPGGGRGFLRWDVPGTFRKAQGTWQLVIDPTKNVIVHFNFVTGG